MFMCEVLGEILRPSFYCLQLPDQKILCDSKTLGDTEYLSVFSPNAGKYGPE